MNYISFLFDEASAKEYVKYLNMLIEAMDNYVLPNVTDIVARQQLMALYNMAIEVRDTLTSEDTKINKFQKLVLKLVSIFLRLKAV